MRLTETVQALIEKHLPTGSIAIDATAGNGYDTLGMAQRVGAVGQVYAIDVQPAALEATRQRLEAAQCLQPCRLLLGDHATILRELAKTLSGQVQLITFNLGYLPGSDKAIRTSEASTLPALQSAIQLLKPGGYLLVTAYRGHAGGLAEADAVASWFTVLDQSKYRCEIIEPEVRGDRIPPILFSAVSLPASNPNI